MEVVAGEAVCQGGQTKRGNKRRLIERTNRRRAKRYINSALPQFLVHFVSKLRHIPFRVKMLTYAFPARRSALRCRRSSLPHALGPRNSVCIVPNLPQEGNFPCQICAMHRNIGHKSARVGGKNQPMFPSIPALGAVWGSRTPLRNMYTTGVPICRVSTFRSCFAVVSLRRSP